MSSTEEQITRESQTYPINPPALNPALFNPGQEELDFLHWALGDSTAGNDEALKEKVLKFQKESYELFAYPCIHGFHFVYLFMSQVPVYPQLLAAAKSAKSPPVFLDLGCCMGSDLRKLIMDGFPTSAGNLLGGDLRDGFIKLGYEFYQDGPQSTKPTPIIFFTDDILDVSREPAVNPEGKTLPETLSLEGLKGKLDYLYAGALFHLFDESTQYAIAWRFARLIHIPPKSDNSDLPDAIIFGRHQGLHEEGYINDHLGRKRYGHSPDSWPKLWKGIFGEIYGEEWAENNVHVTAQINLPLRGFPHPNTMLVWSVTIKRS
ncbi:hypothetical protein SISSUDRAFT_1035235 [Sistotremastrum suecicum HHB10207 ss-3]|uniref:Methyltransferase domain-containing protein n=1 Tax=Sistotremastrum suecicum HHB10207 ss-3 TaxID=1314776 RepID=A0A166B1D5_9AGAM|nr:hypothetical protein SISSUDRAFT_1035235 [Sistotremastrum suecicum HHB10207 ss-3]